MTFAAMNVVCMSSKLLASSGFQVAMWFKVYANKILVASAMYFGKVEKWLLCWGLVWEFYELSWVWYYPEVVVCSWFPCGGYVVWPANFYVGYVT